MNILIFEGMGDSGKGSVGEVIFPFSSFVENVKESLDDEKDSTFLLGVYFIWMCWIKEEEVKK